ncbi:aromatic amino acid ammonia-lyase [Streptococcus saliviloxodontae]|uniref:Histidine ammonia-lyase n=1 Tax=Streptococcus saliviloxodontae TaxID=1349416 RepID=A0ABS2PL51_9STRE|nr:aromatic amino acid ammonia-lyase [Streptococcus saliviloxodontae]MBM7635676.1 histidine ammonia-lyase [Streptococcus saliviloxodontae]
MELTGYELSIEDVQRVVKGEIVSISQDSFERMTTARQVVLEALTGDQAIYGLNTGVGKNKDRRIPINDIDHFNRQLIYAHCVGIEPELTIEEVRATMLIHLNNMVKGYSGVQVAIAERLVDFLNLGITPVVNGKGSIGEGDIGILSYIGLALLGEGLVDYQGKRYTAKEVFESLGLKPIHFGAKDGLSVISSNAASFARLALLVPKLERILKWYDLAYGMSLEALDGNTTPLDDSVVRNKALSGHQCSYRHVKCVLEGSYLFEKNSSGVQDPLSFRNVTLIHGAAYDSLSYVKKQLYDEWESSDDNPMVDITTGRILSTPHFETLNVTLAIEMLNVALSHVSNASVQRMIKLGNPDFTGLSRFLTADDSQFFGLQALQKTAMTLDVEIHHACQILSNVSYPLAGEMEDRQTNLPLIIQELEVITEKLYDLLTIELLYATQAIALRFPTEPPLGKLTRKVFHLIFDQYGTLEDQHQLYAVLGGISRKISQMCIHSLFDKEK